MFLILGQVLSIWRIAIKMTKHKKKGFPLLFTVEDEAWKMEIFQSDTDFRKNTVRRNLPFLWDEKTEMF